MSTSPSPSSSASPIGALPSELLSEIFRLCALSVNQTPADLDGENTCMTVNPFGLDCTLRLSTICRKWRDIIYNQANLWSNICITQTHLLGAGTGTESQLRTEQIETCLTRSGKYLLNILVDARDPDWNWTEDGVGIHANDHELEDDSEFATETDPSEELMPVLFTPAHMSSAISLLLPHLSRWKSLTILTDTWAPMHRALSVINPALTTHGAPLLETLSLLRCNVLPSYFHDFQPVHLKDPAFLSGGDLSVDILPRLKHLLLEGVHVDWDALGARLDSASSKTLESLELRYHCAEVRPTLAQYRKLLSSAPNLQKLSIKCSGAYIPDDKFVLPANYAPVSLPKLEELTLGYQTSEDGEMALELFDAPNVRKLTLEDCSHYASAEQYADDMLAYLASKASYSNDADAAENNAQHPTKPICVSQERADEPGSVTSPKRTYFSIDPLPPFPLLDTVILKRVDGSAEALHTFFRALDHVQCVEISGMTLDALRALLPSVGPGGPSCACPELSTVVVHDIGKATIKEFGYYSVALMRERPKYCYKLRAVELRRREGESEGGQEMNEDEEDAESSGTDSDDDSEVASSVGETAVAAAGVFHHQPGHDLKDQDMNTSFKPDHDGIFNDSESEFDSYYAASQLVCP